MILSINLILKLTNLKRSCKHDPDFSCSLKEKCYWFKRNNKNWYFAQ